jgi:TolB-like protein/DNA-binding winged helix-turn-helix (wHTH) protein
MSYRFGECELDTVRFELHRGGRLVELEPQVFELLAYLVANRDRVVTRRELYERVWRGRIVTDAALNSRIKAARAGIGDDGKTQHSIRTLHRTGYRFVGEVAELPSTDARREQAAAVGADPAAAPLDPGEPLSPAPAVASPAVAATPKPRARLRWPIAATIAIAAASIAWYVSDRAPVSVDADRQPPPVTTQPSIAVLPFVNMSADPEQDYFSDGLTEELINQLSQIDGLLVTARTSAFAFKGRSEDLRSIGEALDVAYILEGSTRKSGERLRITVQLIKVADGYHVWSETFEKRLEDTFATQDEITAAVAARVGPTLGVTARAADYGGTTSFEAYDHLLRGNVEFAAFRMAAAIPEYQSALAIDAGYARAAAQLAVALSSFLGTAPPDAASLERERDEATRRALEGAPSSPIALVAKMWLHSDHHEWVQADDACTAAFAAGKDPRAEGICGGFLTVTGRVRAGLPYREAARRADPLSLNIGAAAARTYAMLGMQDPLARETERLRAIPGERWLGGEPMVIHLMHARAPIGEIRDQLESICAPDVRSTLCPIGPRAIRSPEQAPSLLREELESVRRQNPAGAIGVADLAVYFGDRELALEALSVFARAPGSSTFQGMWYPLLADVRTDPRFKTIVRDIGFVDLWRKTGRWGDFCRPLGDDDFECF